MSKGKLWGVTAGLRINRKAAQPSKPHYSSCWRCHLSHAFLWIFPMWMLSARAHRWTFTLYSAAASVSTIGYLQSNGSSLGSFFETNFNHILKHDRDVRTAATGNSTTSGQRHEDLWALWHATTPVSPHTKKPHLCPCVFAVMSQTVS